MFPLLTTITLGVEPTNPLDIYKALRAKHCKIGSESAMMIEKAVMSLSEVHEVNLVAPLVSDLGYSHGASLGDIFEKAGQHGLELCPAEVSWRLCLERKHVLGKNDRLVIAMEPLAVPMLGLHVFAVLRILGSLYLGAEPGMKIIRFGPTARFVFIQPRA